MADLGGISNFPYELGGEPSREMKAFEALRRMVGEGVHPPGDTYGDATIHGIWRMAKAHGLAAIGSFADSALWQGFPDTVTDELASYEEILSLFPPVGTPDEARRQAVTDRWTRSIESAVKLLEPQLQEIDSRFSVIDVPEDAIRHVQLGRYYDDIADPYVVGATGTFRNGRRHSNSPNFSDDFVLRVLFDVGDVVVTDEISNLRNRASDLLAESLPAWTDYSICHVVGFTLDLSMLDAACFYP